MGSPRSGGQWVVRGVGVSLFNSPHETGFVKIRNSKLYVVHVADQVYVGFKNVRAVASCC